MKPKGFGMRVVAVLGAVALVLVSYGSATAAPTARGSERRSWAGRLDRQSEAAGIVSVLEPHLQGRGLPEKTREKLLTLSDEHIRLVASLAERAATAPDSLEAELALFMIAALLVIL